MTLPAPSDSPKPAEEAAGANPWAPPGPDPSDRAGAAPGGVPGQGGQGWSPAPPTPGAPYWGPFPYPMPAPPPRNGVGIAAMVIGVVGLVLSLAVLLFWLSWLPALLAVILGAVGLVQVRKGIATNRGMALAGVILGVLGLLVSTGAGVFVVSEVRAVERERKAEEEADQARYDAAMKEAEERAAKERERIEAERKRLEAEREKAAADEKARRLSFGQSYTYPDGLKVTMGKPERYVPDETVFRAPKNSRFVQVRITIVNTGSANLALEGAGLPFVRDANGGLLLVLIDGSSRMQVPTGSLAVGQTVTSLTAYAVPNTAGESFSVEFNHGSVLKHVTWSGPVG
ncbi:DUF4190 domain-containing protein [Kitasatospora sp. NPDC057965]|uniref:DUF4190 domain-containing protein n=1 Tax=Kitasatospora sp. NPDC057965 TaxID=3346291 RepID=UPI0036DACAD7